MAVREQAEPDLDGWADPDPDDGGGEGHTPEVRRVGADQAEARLAEVVATFGGQPRQPQIDMARHIADAIDDRTAALVHGPTGTGKALALAVPASLAAGRLPVLISTATKALQQQLCDHDLPAISQLDPDLDVAVLKGRGEYLCKKQVAGLTVEEPLFDAPVDPDAWDALLDWADSTGDGDRANAPDGVSDAAWRAVSVSARECVGKDVCPFGEVCFAEQARDRARAANIVLVNHHLLLLDALADRWLLPQHEVVMVDELHKLEQIASSVFGAQVHPKTISDLAAQAGRHVDAKIVDRLADAGDDLKDLLAELPTDQPVDVTVEPAAGVLDELAGAVRRCAEGFTQARNAAADDAASTDTLIRLEAIAAGLRSDLGLIVGSDDGQVVFVEQGRGSSRTLKVAPIDVAPTLSELLFTDRTVIGCSATIAVGNSLDPVASRIGLDDHPWRPLLVDSPFDYPSNALLYVPRDAPDPRQPGYDDIAYDTTLRIIEAAQGRTLCLFTSWTRLNATADWLAGRLPPGVETLVQGDAPPRRLIERYIHEPNSVLLGVASFWEGISAEGLSSVAVVIDKLPFPRRGDPLIDARRQAAGQAGFSKVDLPLTAITLAQGVGRLIRTVDDFGLICVLDSRLATAGYRNTLLGSIPPARRTINLDLPDGMALTADPDDQIAQLTAVPGGPPALPWLQARLAAAGS